MTAAEAMAKELLLYREGVETLMRLKSTSWISNAEPTHAAILLETFFRHAQSHVRIFCEQLSSKVFNSPSLVDAAKWALNRGAKISVLYQKEQPEESDLLTELQKSHSLVMRVCTDGQDNPDNFAVMDEQAYRLEPDRHKCEAKAIMFDPHNAKRFAQKFDLLLLTTKIEAAHLGLGGAASLVNAL